MNIIILEFGLKALDNQNKVDHIRVKIESTIQYVYKKSCTSISPNIYALEQ